MSRSKRRSESEWLRLFDEQARSGLSVQAFCAERHIGYSTFSHWKARLSASGSTGQASNRFVELSAPAVSSARHWDVELSLGEDIILRISRQ